MYATLGWLATPDTARARPARVGPIWRHRMLDESSDCWAASEVAAVRTKIESAEQTRDLRTRTTSQVSACRPQMRPLGNMPFVPRLGYMPARHGVILSDPCHPERPMSS